MLKSKKKRGIAGFIHWPHDPKHVRHRLGCSRAERELTRPTRQATEKHTSRLARVQLDAARNLPLSMPSSREDLEHRIVLRRIGVHLDLRLPKLRRAPTRVKARRIAQATLPTMRRPVRAHQVSTEKTWQHRRGDDIARLLLRRDACGVHTPDDERARADATAADTLEGAEVVAEHVECEAKAGFGCTGSGSRQRRRVAGEEADGAEEAFARTVGDASDERAEGNRDEAECEGDTPLAASDAGDGEGCATDKDNEDLSANFYTSVSVTTLQAMMAKAYR